MTAPVVVEQFVPTLLSRDAVGNHTLRTRDALRSAGIPGDVWAMVIGADCAGEARPFPELPAATQPSGTVLLYQFASGSRGMVDRLLGRPEPLVVYYHNLTPPRFYEPWDAVEAEGLRAAAEELSRLAERAAAAIATSAFGARELTGMGVADVVVCPPFLGPSLAFEPDRELLSHLAQDAGMKLLFVGRLAPNKGHEHLLSVVDAVREGIDPSARLYLVGPPGPPAYMRQLSRTAEMLAEDGIVITGSVSDAALAAYYRAADVFLCMSEHEGFGIPLVEAMHFDLPVVALDTTAVGETLGGAGMLLTAAEPLVAAEAIRRVVEDGDLRESLLRRQRERAQALVEVPRADILVDAVDRAAKARGL